MKKLLLFVALTFSATTFAQTSVFADDFETGGGSWTLNSGGFGANDWIVNNVYAGNFLTNTPTQPGAISPSNGNYLHIYNQGTACAGLGDCQAVFLASTGGDKTAEMTNSVSTAGLTNVSFNFYYLCMGMNNATYGAVDYSIDNGVTWVNATTNYSGVGAWTSESITNPAFDNQAQLKFRFHWIESTVGNDPAFAVDQVEILGMAGGSNTITTTNDVSPASWCQGTDQVLTVNYTSSGTWNASNVFSIQLSDASGSFAAPTVIGSLLSTASSGTVTGTVPGATPAGTGYRVRIVADDPTTTGSDNVSDLVINMLPTVTLSPFTQVCVYDPFFTLTGGAPASGTFTGAGVAANLFDPSVAGTGSHVITYTFTDGNGCSNSAQETIVVDACLGVEENEVSFSVYPNPAEDYFTIVSDSEIEKVELLDMKGCVVNSFGEQNTYDISNVPTGMYLIKIQANSSTVVERIVVR